MQLQKNKKILFYFFLFLIIGTFNNKNINNFEFPKISQIKVSGLSDEENDKILQVLEIYKIYNLFSLNKTQIKKSITQYNQIEEIFIFKKYPHSLNVKLIETKLLAYIIKNEKVFYLGSNGKLIETKDKIKKLPYIFGDIEVRDFFELKKAIKDSVFKFEEIKNLFFFPSGRWDIETYSGILIKLPKNKLKESLNLSIKLIEKDKFEKIKMIDLRQANQVITNG